MAYVANEKRYENMTYNKCGESGLKIPAVSLGLWHNFGDTGNFENMKAMCRTAFDLGITHFDLANNYGPAPGSAERNFGKILKDDFLQDEELAKNYHNGLCLIFRLCASDYHHYSYNLIRCANELNNLLLFL